MTAWGQILSGFAVAARLFRFLKATDTENEWVKHTTMLQFTIVSVTKRLKPTCFLPTSCLQTSHSRVFCSRPLHALSVPHRADIRLQEGKTFRHFQGDFDWRKFSLTSLADVHEEILRWGVAEPSGEQLVGWPHLSWGKTGRR